MESSQSGKGMQKKSTICLVPKLEGIGGMVSFQGKLVEGFSQIGIDVCYEPQKNDIDAILVIGGTRHLHRLWSAKQNGIRIVQRLDGMNWIHRVINTGRQHWFKAEYGNMNLRLIRSYLADKIVYQSRFSKDWWERERGETKSHNVIIHNGVDLSRFTPGDLPLAQNKEIKLLLVEGSLLGGYEFGLKNAIYLALGILRMFDASKRVNLSVIGKVSESLKKYWEQWLRDNNPSQALEIIWAGIVDHQEIPEVYRQAHLLFSADINAACPNSVIESLACGTPVVAFDTGALAELLDNKGGEVVPYGGNPWKVEQPDIGSLVKSAGVILGDLDNYRRSARLHAEAAFDLDTMVEQYADVLLG
jgi:glycosyltransferase involved in cell wall biosynthesis